MDRRCQIATVIYVALAFLSLLRVLAVRGLVAELAAGLLYFGASTVLIWLLLAWISRRFVRRQSQPADVIAFPTDAPIERPNRRAA